MNTRLRTRLRENWCDTVLIQHIMQCNVRVDLCVPKLIVSSQESSSRSKEFEDALIQSKLPAAVAKEAKGSKGAIIY